MAGFEVSAKGCCGTELFETSILSNKFDPFTFKDANKYVFWDSIRPSERTNKILSDHFLPSLKTQFLWFLKQIWYKMHMRIWTYRILLGNFHWSQQSCKNNILIPLIPGILQEHYFLVWGSNISINLGKLYHKKSGRNDQYQNLHHFCLCS